jgi:aminopeptidase
MDPRVREHAEVIVNHCTNVERRDNVSIYAPPVAEDLVVALYELLGERGANPSTVMDSSRAMRAFVRASDADDFELPAHSMAAMEEADVSIVIEGSYNTNEASDVDPEAITAYGTAMKPLQDERLEKRWVGTQYPTPGNAQRAEMSTEAYEEFVWNAVIMDWDAQREHQEQLVEILDPAETVRVVSGETTDIMMSVSGMDAVNDYGENNLPGGEVFTAPVPDSVEGEVLFDKPLMAQGREVENVRLVFKDGEVVEHSAEKNEGVLTGVLNADEGASRLGELGIGMNRDIDRFTYNMLFDEKIGDTIHMAIGRAIDETVPEGMEANDSAMHMDMIVDMSEDSRIEIDGETVQRNGTFIFEDGFEA